MDNGDRNKVHKRDPDLEEILSLLNQTLDDDEKSLTKEFIRPVRPVLFIVGNARSGSTLLYQWLASTGLFGYPSNIISRFYQAPYIGALIQKTFTDYDRHGELFGSEALTCRSTLGKTAGALSPHEFWYFWRRFFRFGEIQYLTGEELRQVPSGRFLSELAALEHSFGKPMLLKGMILNRNLSYLNRLIDQVLFLHIRREEIQNMASLYHARIDYFGTPGKWYSFKPPEYPVLKNMTLYEQLAGQVVLTNRAIEQQFAEFPKRSTLTIHYEELCRNPEKVYHDIQNSMELLGNPIREPYRGSASFELPGPKPDSTFHLKSAEEALRKMEEYEFENSTSNPATR
ncbi:MAG: sulfotransferase [Balneolaceae bacterium]